MKNVNTVDSFGTYHTSNLEEFIYSYPSPLKLNGSSSMLDLIVFNLFKMEHGSENLAMVFI